MWKMGNRLISFKRETLMLKATFVFTFISYQILIVSNALAQEPDLAGTTQTSAVLDFESEQNNLIFAFDGWSSLYKGYDRSQILFPPGAAGNPTWSSSYPEIHGRESFITPVPSLEMLNLGVEDEIARTSMAIYQPLSHLRTQFVGDHMLRDQHLDLFKSLRGTALLTLSFLDKTVAAGLATTQAQADAQTTNHILKQISWTTSKLANPQRYQIYSDIDEKVEACMSDSARHGRTPSYDGGRIYLDCQDVEKCGIRELSGKYEFCVCCAEVTSSINSAVNNEIGVTLNGPDNEWSLVDRVLFGIKMPNLTGPEIVDRVRKTIKRVYGDIKIVPVDASGAGPAKLRYEFRHPNMSVPQRIDVFRNGTGGGGQYDPSPFCRVGTAGNCQGLGTPLKIGICPAVKFIVKSWPPDDFELNPGGGAYRILQEHWKEASLGYILSGQELTNIVNMDYVPKVDRAISGWEPEGRQARFIEAFCDASAVAAFKRMHLKLKSIIIDHIAVNQKASQEDKQRMMGLVARVEEALMLAERDVDADFATEQMVNGLAIETDRTKLADIGAAAAGSRNTIDNNSQKGSTTRFGNFNNSGGN